MRRHIAYFALTMALLCGCGHEQSPEHGDTEKDDETLQSAETEEGTSTEEHTGEAVTEAEQLSEEEVRFWLYDKSVAVTEGLKGLSGDRAYLKALSSADELVEQVLEWSVALQEKPGEIYIIPLDSELTEILMEESVMGELSSIEEQTVDYLRSRMLTSLGFILNARFGGTTEVASAGIASYSETFRMDGFEAESQTWLIRYTDELGVCVAFNATGDDVLTVSASFVIWPTLTEEEQQGLFGDAGPEQLGIEHVEAADMQR